MTLGNQGHGVRKNCNCSYGCPCQFNALPTHGFCEAAVALEMNKAIMAT